DPNRIALEGEVFRDPLFAGRSGRGRSGLIARRVGELLRRGIPDKLRVRVRREDYWDRKNSHDSPDTEEGLTHSTKPSSQSQCRHPEVRQMHRVMARVAAAGPGRFLDSLWARLWIEKTAEKVCSKRAESPGRERV